MFPTITVIIGNTKKTGKMVFHPLAPILEYQHNDSIICCFGMLASAFTASGENVAAQFAMK